MGFEMIANSVKKYCFFGVGTISNETMQSIPNTYSFKWKIIVVQKKNYFITAYFVVRLPILFFCLVLTCWPINNFLFSHFPG